MMGKVYIQAAEQISIQNPLSEAWMEEPIVYHEPFVKAVNPAFREYIAPNEARRMGNIMKRALVTSLKVRVSAVWTTRRGSWMIWWRTARSR